MHNADRGLGETEIGIPNYTPKLKAPVRWG